MLVKQDILVIKSRFIADSFIVGEKPLGLYVRKEVLRETSFTALIRIVYWLFESPE